MAKLLCETNTNAIRRLVIQVAREVFSKTGAKPVFEHGQWWVVFRDGSIYAVCDATGPGSVKGLCFELVTEGKE